VTVSPMSFQVLASKVSITLSHK